MYQLYIIFNILPEVITILVFFIIKKIICHPYVDISYTTIATNILSNSFNYLIHGSNNGSRFLRSK